MADLLAGNFYFIGRPAQRAIQQLRRHTVAVNRLGAHFRRRNDTAFVRRISPGPRRSPWSVAGTAQGNPGISCESSLRKMTKPAKSLSSLPSTYSVGRLQVSTTPSAAGFAAKFVISCGVANSGARGSPFLPHALATSNHEANTSNAMRVSFKTLNSFSRRTHIASRRAAQRPPPPDHRLPPKDSDKCPFQSCWKTFATPPSGNSSMRCPRLGNAAPPCPRPHGPGETAHRARPDNRPDPWRS